MMATVGAQGTGTLGEFKKEQAFSYTSPAAGIGRGERSNPNQFMPHWTPAPNNYEIVKEAKDNDAPKFKIGKGKRQEQRIPNYPGPAADKKIPVKGYVGEEGPKWKMGQKKIIDRRDQDGLGPGAYLIKANNTAPQFSMGSRFDSDVRNKDHIRPRKKDGPGPGSYEAPSCVKVATTTKRTTFGVAGRDWSDLPKHSPAPNNYYPNKFTEANHQYSFPKSMKSDEAKLYKSSFTPGPGAYEIRREDKQEGPAKSFLGGPDQKKDIDNGVPGPGHYNPKELEHPPGFRIVPQQRKNSDGDLSGDEKEKAEPVGPQKYYPEHPAHTSVGVKFGSGTRDDLKQKFFTPAPNNYTLKSDFEKALEKPQFHMGIKTGIRGNKNLDMPGPGEYETDVAPLHHTNVAHVIGTSVRSDLGVGKAHLFPGPGEYETRTDIDGPQIGFGTQMKLTKIKKTFEPGPGSYDLPSTVGHIPKYLLMASGEAITKSQMKSQKDES